MKKFLTVCAVVITAFLTSAKAQIINVEGMPPYKLGITVGLNVPSMSGDGLKYTTGIHAGLNLMLDASNIIENTYGRFELRYSMKGANFKDSDFRLTTHYLEIPIHYGYAWAVHENVTLMAETGPYFAWGLGGRLRSTDNNVYSGPGQNEWAGWNVEVYRKFFDDAKRFDLGWGLHIGAMFFDKFQVTAGYDWGFMNATNDFLQNRNIAIGLTYFIE